MVVRSVYGPRACRRLAYAGELWAADVLVCSFGDQCCEKSYYGGTCKHSEWHDILLVGLIVP